MLKWFECEHLPDDLKIVALQFKALAELTCELCYPGPERTVALRKLLESKDAAVRAALNQGG
jgi:hypothetical protein